MSLKTIAITGSSGFVGRHLCEEARQRNIKYVTVRRQPIESAKMELPFAETWIHLAGRAHILNESSSNPASEFFKANSEYAVKIAEEAFHQGMKRFVYVSSVGVYGLSGCQFPISEDTEENPNELYAQSKLDGEQRLKKLAIELGFELVIVRPALVYGFDAPGNIQRVLVYLVKRKIVPFATSRNKRTFLSVENLVDFLLFVSEASGAAGETFNIADGETLSTRDFYESIAEGMDKETIFIELPRALWKATLSVFGRKKLYQQLFEDLVLDSSKACKLLGWKQPLQARVALRKVGEQFSKIRG